MTLDDLELLHVRIFGKFHGISQTCEASNEDRPVLSATAHSQLNVMIKCETKNH